MILARISYFGDFVAIPVWVLVMALDAYWREGVSGAPHWALGLAIGLAVWTLVEYCVHRFVYHDLPFFARLHDAHHERPKSLVGFPSFVASALIVAVCYWPWRGSSPAGAAGFASGLAIGYAVYMFVHHATHHFALRDGGWLYRARLRHNAHHYRDGVNFGVTTGFWDRIFGTEWARGEGRVRA
jgi:sterol desaturase/sphingolipid hydroxylase (fatty acid hydroxylase superfamily)